MSKNIINYLYIYNIIKILFHSTGTGICIGFLKFQLKMHAQNLADATNTFTVIVSTIVSVVLQFHQDHKVTFLYLFSQRFFFKF